MQTTINTTSDEVKTTSERINLINTLLEIPPKDNDSVELNTYIGTFFYIYLCNSWRPLELN